MLSSYLCPSGLLGSIRIAAPWWFAAVLLTQAVAFAHEGHDHGDPATSTLDTSAYPRVAAQSELYEIVGILKNDGLEIYLDHFGTNEPVTGAKVTVAIGDRESIDAPLAESGAYMVVFPRLSRVGSVELVFNIAAKSGDDLLVGSIALPQAVGTSATSPSGDGLMKWLAAIRSLLRNPTVMLALFTCMLAALAVQLVRRRFVIPAITTGVATALLLGLLVTVAFGEVAPGATNALQSATTGVMSDAPRRLSDGTAFVAKPTQRLLEVRTVTAKSETARPAVNLIGRVIGDPNRTSVVQSLHGGRVIPLEKGLPRIGQSVRKGEILVQVDPYLPLADRTTISEKTGEIEQLIAVAEAKLRRLRPLAERGAVPQSQVIDLETELEGLRARREVVRSTRNEPEILAASTDGVIASVKVVPGQVVQAQDLLFQVIDPKGLWAEGLAYGDLDPSSLVDATAATTSGQAMSLVYQGLSRALQQHASVLHFSIPDPPTNLSVGQALTVTAKSGAPITGLIVQRDAVVRSVNGETIVWLHVGPERFEARSVRIQQFDASRVIIAGGVKDDERIVVRGAGLINQVR